MRPKITIEERSDGMTTVSASFPPGYLVQKGQEAIYQEILRKVVDAYLEENQDKIIASIDLDRISARINDKVLATALRQMAKEA